MSVPLPSVPETSVASRSSHENESSSVYTAASDYCNLLFPPLLPLPIVVAPVVARAIRGAIKRGEDKGKIKGRGGEKVENSVERGPSSVVSKSMRRSGGKRKNGGTKEKRGREAKGNGRDLSWKGERGNKNARRKGREGKVFSAKTLHRLTTIESDLPLDSH